MLELVVRVGLSLAVVLGLFWLVARGGARKLGGRERGLVRVRSRQGLSRGSSLAVVEVGSRVLVLGVSDNGVRLLTELDPADLGEAASVVEAGSREPALAPVATATVTSEVVTEPAESFEQPEPTFEQHEPSFEDELAAYAESYRTAHRVEPAGTAHRGETRAVSGSLLDADVWRQAWHTALGRGPRGGAA